MSSKTLKRKHVLDSDDEEDFGHPSCKIQSGKSKSAYPGSSSAREDSKSGRQSRTNKQNTGSGRLQQTLLIDCIRKKHNSVRKDQDENSRTEEFDQSSSTQSKSTLPEWPDEDKISVANLSWRKISAENLDLVHCQFYSKTYAAAVLERLDREIDWNTDEESKVQVFGKWHRIPRKQAAYGDAGLSYAFSGRTVFAKPWIPILQEIREKIHVATGHNFNFVLANRYKDGLDHIGEHRDDEKDLVEKSPIASLSLGQTRDFVFKHGDARAKHAKRKIEPVKLELQSGCLLLMNYPTNKYWYHSLPVRKSALAPRINLTFRDFVSVKR